MYVNKFLTQIKDSSNGIAVWWIPVIEGIKLCNI